MSEEIEISVLDHGYVRFVESWGSDERIIEAARMSTAKGFQGWGPRCGRCGHAFLDSDGVSCLTEGCQGGRSERVNGDEKLLRYLYEHKHATPFEMAGMVIEVQAPIFVFREWHRHRTQSYNEMSARYVQMPDLHYVPSVDRIIRSAEASRNKQASGSGSALTAEQAETVRKRIAGTQREVYVEYDTLIKIYGLSREVARINTPVSRYSRMRASTNLRNWLAFLTLRMDEAAQWEIRQFALGVGHYIADCFPRTWGLFCEGRSG